AKSCESLFSGSSRESASQIYQRKPPQRGMKNGGVGAMRQPAMVPNNTNSDIHQRVMSARNLRVKTFQNQLTDAQAEIANLAHENRMLRTMHKRQSTALNKYESTGAELPQLLHSHAEELRVWQTKFRNVQATNKELEAKLKQKEAQILSLSDQNRHFSQLIKDKNLDERQKLQDRLRTLEQRLQEKDNDMKLMSRKVQLEAKNYRQQLLNEQKKTKEVLLKLEKARLEMSGYRKLEEFTIDKANPLASGRRTKLNAVEETDKIDKLEKSLDMLDKAIEKNNQSEFNALTDVLETDSNYEFDKDDGDEEKIAMPANDAAEKDNNKAKRGKLTLPPAPVPPKPVGTKGSANASRLSLSQMLQQNKALKPTPVAARLRSGASVNGSVSTLASSNVRGSAASSKLATVEGKVNKLQSMSKPLEFDYDDDSDHGQLDVEDDDEDDDVDAALISKMCRGAEDDIETSDDVEDINPNEDGPVNYSAYLHTKCELSEMLAMEEVDEDGDDDDDSGDQSPKLPIDDLLNQRQPPIMKENMSNIRKLISDDYKDRENFLDIHCRPTSGNNNNKTNNVRDDAAKKKRNNILPSGVGIGTGALPASRKHALLAALKVIDDNKDED
ncbi:hypothetical protein KR044_008278, partial [Drosophila immigrans]